MKGKLAIIILLLTALFTSCASKSHYPQKKRKKGKKNCYGCTKWTSSLDTKTLYVYEESTI